MKDSHRVWLRGVATLAVLGVAAGALLASPVGAVVKPKKVKKIAKKQANLAVVAYSAADEGVFSHSVDGPVDIASVGAFPAPPAVPTLTTIASLSLPAGAYAINAKLYSENTGTSNDVLCRLIAGAAFDETRLVSNDDANFTAMSLQLAHELTAPGSVRVDCADDAAAPNTDDKARYVKITAVRAPSLTLTTG